MSARTFYLREYYSTPSNHHDYMAFADVYADARLKMVEPLVLRGALKMLDSAVRYINQSSTQSLHATELALRILLKAAGEVSTELRNIGAEPAIDEYYSATRL